MVENYDASDSPRVRKAAHHADYLRIYAFRDHSSLSGNILQHLMQCLRFDLLPLELTAGIVEIENDTTLLQFLHEQVIAFFRSYLCELGHHSTKPRRMKPRMR